MSETLALRRRLRQSIGDDIAHRTAVHQARMAAMKSSGPDLMLTGAVAPQPALTLLAVGDSWFDYPLIGNGPIPSDTDVIAQLRGLGTPKPIILNVAHFGDATTDEIGTAQAGAPDRRPRRPGQLEGRGQA